MANRKFLHVTPEGEGWVIKREGEAAEVARLRTQAEAFERAREIAQREGGEVLVHGEDGQIRDRRSYGGDPNPPKG